MLKAIEKAEADYQAKIKEVEGIADANRKRAQAAERSAAGARTELDGLRNVIARAKENAVATTGADGPAAATADVFGACSTEYQRVEEEAGKLAAQVIGLQEYVSRVCVSQ
jgi:RNA 3'-terminal phosphate cyclase